MALYENGKRISGIRDFPAYTWDEYHALPVAKRPKVWKCTDRDYTQIPPEEILTSPQTITANATNVTMPLSENLDANCVYTVKYTDFQGYGNTLQFVPYSNSARTAKALVQTIYTHTMASKGQLLIMNKTWWLSLLDGSTSTSSITVTSVLKSYL